jgi:hypothetical protein
MSDFSACSMPAAFLGLNLTRCAAKTGIETEPWRAADQQL